MNQPAHSLPPQYFEQVYAANADPWQFATSPYERDKYAATLAALPNALYASGFEIGCSIGILTAQLATRCQELLAVDVSEAALQQARQRLVGQPQVRIENRQIPADFPRETFDLILLSEVGYYWSRADLAVAKEQMLAQLRPGGHLLLVHWTPPVADYPLTGDDVHESFLEHTGEGKPLLHRQSDRHETYRLDLFERV